MTTRFGFISTYPPTLCGLATFTASLLAELAPRDAQVVRVVETLQPSVGPEVVAQLLPGDPASVRRAARALDSCDVVVVQHEYGVYGGPDGDEVLDVLAALTVPYLVVFHTVLTSPTVRQRRILCRVAAGAAAVVVMTPTAYSRLEAGYAVDMAKVEVIPHGAPTIRALAHIARGAQRPLVLTWGLLGPGKGIEWGIDAMASLTDLVPLPRYVVAGQTHPKVLLREGEDYRSQLSEQARQLGLCEVVTLENRYRDLRSLTELVASADVVLLPYDSTDQVTSGVLIEALAAGKPVVSTGFPHAVEMLSDGAGIVVAHRDPAAISAALRTLLTEGEVAAQMSRAALATSQGLAWSSVAQRYRDLIARLIIVSHATRVAV